MKFSRLLPRTTIERVFDAEGNTLKTLLEAISSAVVGIQNYLNGSASADGVVHVYLESEDAYNALVTQGKINEKYIYLIAEESSSESEEEEEETTSPASLSSDVLTATSSLDASDNTAVITGILNNDILTI